MIYDLMSIENAEETVKLVYELNSRRSLDYELRKMFHEKFMKFKLNDLEENFPKDLIELIDKFLINS